MGPGLTVVMLTRDDPRFYPLLGPFLASRLVARETGSVPWDDDGKAWWTALDCGQVAGFCAAVPRGAAAEFCSAWVAPEYRGRGVYALLADARDRDCAGREARVTCRRGLVPFFAARGFGVTRETARFARMRRPA